MTEFKKALPKVTVRTVLRSRARLQSAQTERRKQTYNEPRRIRNKLIQERIGQRSTINLFVNFLRAETDLDSLKKKINTGMGTVMFQEKELQEQQQKGG